MASGYDRGYDDCFRFNGDDADENCPFDFDSPQYQAYMSGWARGQEELKDIVDDYEFDDDNRYNGEDDNDDCQPDEYTEWQDFYGGDDWDQGQYDD